MNEKEINARIENSRPKWINEKLDYHDVRGIQCGGCASGYYSPAVIYTEASEIMDQCGNEVLDYIVDQTDGLPILPSSISWDGVPSYFLAIAVELWASQFDLSNIIEGGDW